MSVLTINNPRQLSQLLHLGQDERFVNWNVINVKS